MEEKVWVEKYYLETDRERRKEMLDQAIAEEGMTRENEIRLKFWERRYETREKDNVQIDRFIRGWMEMSYMNTSSRSAFGRKKLEREKEKVLDDWSMELARSYGEEGEEAFYQELCNTLWRAGQRQDAAGPLFALCFPLFCDKINKIYEKNPRGTKIWTGGIAWKKKYGWRNTIWRRTGKEEKRCWTRLLRKRG